MSVVTGNMDAFYCYPCCCAYCGDCSCYQDYGCDFSPYYNPYRCSAGSCGNCYWPAYDIAYVKLTNGCDTTCGCRPDLPELSCGLLGQIYDYTTQYYLNNTEVVDCGPSCYFVCNQNFIGCMTAGAWFAIGNGSINGVNYCSYFY